MPYDKKKKDKEIRKQVAIKKLKGSLRDASKDPNKREKFLDKGKMSKFKFGR
jgi:hypothetical protein